MDTLGDFLKTALYRVIFVLIVGIPAVELFCYYFFSNYLLLYSSFNLSGIFLYSSSF